MDRMREEELKLVQLAHLSALHLFHPAGARQHAFLIIAIRHDYDPVVSSEWLRLDTESATFSR
jgi:hypothetical protein